MHAHEYVHLLYSVLCSEGNYAETVAAPDNHRKAKEKHDHTIAEGSGGTPRLTRPDEVCTGPIDTTDETESDRTSAVDVGSGITNSAASIHEHTKNRNTNTKGTTPNYHTVDNTTYEDNTCTREHTMGSLISVKALTGDADPNTDTVEPTLPHRQ